MTIPSPPPGYKLAAEIPEQAGSQPLERFKCYADGPDGKSKNKYLVYKTHDIDHSINLLMRLVKEGWKVRAAFHEFPDERTIRIEQHARNAGVI